MSISEHLDVWFNEYQGVLGFYNMHAPRIHASLVVVYAIFIGAGVNGLYDPAQHVLLIKWVSYIATVVGVSGVALHGHAQAVQATQRLAREMHTMLSDVEITGHGKYYTPPGIVDPACGSGSLVADAAKASTDVTITGKPDAGEGKA